MRINCTSKDCVYFYAGLCSRQDSITIDSNQRCECYERKETKRYDSKRGTSTGFTSRYR